MRQNQLSAAVSQTNSPICVLAVVSPTTAKELERIISRTRWKLHCVDSISAAKAVLEVVPVSVVLCDSRVGNGTWGDVVNITAQTHPRPETIVLVERAVGEAVFGEILNGGAYDVLPLPVEPRELYATIPMAWRHSRSKEKDPTTVPKTDPCNSYLLI
jgi:DNA-binding NtrC family response regulator